MSSEHSDNMRRDRFGLISGYPRETGTWGQTNCQVSNPQRDILERLRQVKPPTPSSPLRHVMWVPVPYQVSTFVLLVFPSSFPLLLFPPLLFLPLPFPPSPSPDSYCSSTLCLGQRSAPFFCKRPDCTCFRFYGPYSVC